MTTKPEDALVERLREYAVAFGMSVGPHVEADIKQAADAITTLLERERKLTEALAGLLREVGSWNTEAAEIARAALTGEAK